MFMHGPCHMEETCNCSPLLCMMGHLNPSLWPRSALTRRTGASRLWRVALCAVLCCLRCTHVPHGVSLLRCICRLYMCAGVFEFMTPLRSSCVGRGVLCTRGSGEPIATSKLCDENFQSGMPHTQRHWWCGWNKAHTPSDNTVHTWAFYSTLRRLMQTLPFRWTTEWAIFLF